MKKGDLIKTLKGNLAIILDSYQIAGTRYVDLIFASSGYVRTCFPAYKCEVISENR